MWDFKDLKFGHSRVQIVCWGSEIAEEFGYNGVTLWDAIDYLTQCPHVGCGSNFKYIISENMLRIKLG